MTTKKKVIALLVIIIIILLSISYIYYEKGVQKFFGVGISQGEIEYAIQYHDNPEKANIINLLPTTMSYKFKNNNICQRITGFMGVFSMAGIINTKLGIKSGLLKLMNYKFVFQTQLEGPAFGYDEIPTMKLEETNDTKIILGYTCKKINVSFSDTTLASFSIYYTDAFNIDNPNLTNPYKQVSGVLLEYQMTFQGIQMSLKATKIEEKEIPDEEFEVPTGYKKISKEDMQNFMNSLM